MPFDPLPILMFIAGAGIVAWVLMRRGMRRRGGGRQKFDSRPIDTQPRPTSEWSGAYSDAAAQIERQKVELAEFSRDVTGQIDPKNPILRELVRQSDERIRRMEEMLAELEERSGAGGTSLPHSSHSGIGGGGESS